MLHKRNQCLLTKNFSFSLTIPEQIVYKIQNEIYNLFKIFIKLKINYNYLPSVAQDPLDGAVERAEIPLRIPALIRTWRTRKSAAVPLLLISLLKPLLVLFEERSIAPLRC